MWVNINKTATKRQRLQRQQEGIIKCAAIDMSQ